MKLSKGYLVNNILKRIKLLEDSTSPMVVNMYYFNPKHKTVYRKVGQYSDTEHVYMDWETVMNDEYKTFKSLVALPTYENENWEEEQDGIWCVCVEGANVINDG